MLNYLLYKLGEFLMLRLPIKIGYKIAVFISDIRYIFAFQDRGAVKENLKAIFPDKSSPELRQMRRRMFRNFAKYLVDFFRFSKINLEYIKRNITIENRHYLDQALALGKGVIILSAHIGNWELGGIVVSLLGYPLWIVALPHKYKKINQFFNRQRESKGIKVIPLGRAYRACINVIKKNEMVAIVGDREFSKEGGALINFFGKNSILPEGPSALAARTGAAILPVFMVRNSDDTFTLKIDPPINTGGKQATQLMLECRDIIQDYIRVYPDQWYMFRRFWVS